MLYEVITLNGGVIPGKLKLMEPSQLKTYRGGFSHCSGGGEGCTWPTRNEEQKKNNGRITSYNVCYTKLLRDGLKQSPDRSVSELDIIDSAVQVQNYLLDVVAVFYEMQLGDSIDNIEDLFQQRMTQFSRNNFV